MLQSNPPFFQHKEKNDRKYSSNSEDRDSDIQDAPLNLTCRKSPMEFIHNKNTSKIKEECINYPTTIGSWSIVQTPIMLPGMKSTSWNYPWTSFPLMQMREQSLQYQQAYWQIIHNLIRSRMQHGNLTTKEESPTLHPEISTSQLVGSSASPTFVTTPKEDFQNYFSFGSTTRDDVVTSPKEPESPRMIHAKQRVKRSNSANKCNFKCSQCGVTYPHRFELNRHIKVSHVRPHRCEHCGKGFGHKNYLQVHIETVHLGRKIHKCDLCGKYLSTGGNLSVHIRTIHMGEKKYKCSVCSRTFGQQCNMKTHMKRHFFKQPEQKCVTTNNQH